MNNSDFKYTVIFERAEEGGYLAYAPKLPGCFSQGESYEEAERNIMEAMQLYLESLVEDNEEIPIEGEKITTTISIPSFA